MDSRSLLLLVLCLVGCSSQLEVPFFNYLDCRVKMRANYEAEGISSSSADMKSMAYCRELFPEQN